jgi:hypothetical protein
MWENGMRAKPTRFVTVIACAATASGCAYIDFGGPGLPYFEPVPYLFVAPAAECSLIATLVMLPGEKRYLKFVNGYGSVDLSVSLGNAGMISNVGHKVDNKVSDTITSLAALQAAFATSAATRAAPAPACQEKARLFPILNGVLGDPVALPNSR